MKIAILSGKGGTGKTFVSVNLTAAMKNATYVDCDVEEPNGALFFKPKIGTHKSVTVQIPSFDKEKCTGCKECVNFCAFHALAFVKEEPMLFPELCHSCGGCLLVCKHGAVLEKKKQVGEVLIGKSGMTNFLSGMMKVGEVSGVPIIKKLLEYIPENGNTVIDCPPGSGCMVMESVKDADYCIIVAEPTEFGRHNFEMVYELVNVFHKPVGVVLNKCVDGANPSEEFCKEKKIDIISKIPFEKEIGKQNAQGEVVFFSNKEAEKIFHELLYEIEKKVIM